MNLKNAVKKAQNKNKVSIVDSGSYKPNANVKIKVKPISRIDESQDHFIIDRHEDKLSSVVNDIESKDDIPSEFFIIQFVENGNSTMGDITDGSDVFDENIFRSVDDAVQWIEEVGYI